MAERPPVTDWATDFDHLSDEWGARGPEIVAELRERCPVAHTERFHGAYLVTRYDDIAEVARDTTTFSSRITLINDNHPDDVKLELPPITLDPPGHSEIRRPMLPLFNPKEVAQLEPFIRESATKALDAIEGHEYVDGAEDFAQLIPVDLMMHLYGVESDLGPQFRSWVDGMLKDGVADIEIARKANREVQAYFVEEMNRRRAHPTDDLISTILHAEADLGDGGTRPFTERERIGTLFVLLLGGIDTTWSSIGSALYHLATNPDDLARLAADPELMPSAVEEFLRFYSPVTIARVIKEDAEIAGCPVDAGKRLLLSYPSANRDPSHFESPDEVIIDRENNRHMAFGVGVHRCLGSNLARTEMVIALTEWVKRFPRFELAVDPSDIVWTVGPVRGPRKVPLHILS